MNQDGFCSETQTATTAMHEWLDIAEEELLDRLGADPGKVGTGRGQDLKFIKLSESSKFG